MITIRKAAQGEADLLSDLAKKIYKEHYLYLWLPGGPDWYMEEYAYNTNKIAADLNEPNVEYYIVLQGNQPVGYMKLVLEAILPGDGTVRALEVERIYLFRQASGKGIGRRLMDLAMDRARHLKKEIIFLKAMDSGIAAMEFYKTLGFVVTGSLQLPERDFALMKPEFRGMMVLRKPVE
jgi:ribosomal protein S18 acetylase RimI-like enzyme